TVWSARDGERFGLPRTYSTIRGQQSMQQLPDGSVLRLNTDSQVTVRYSRRERTVELERGQALFQVAPNPQRPFRVAAGNVRVQDLGTQFDVYRKPDVVTVTVVEGTVAVYVHLPVQAPTEGLAPSALTLDAGYAVDVGRKVGAPRAIDARTAVAWLQRQIAFENTPLGEVAIEFNRYSAVPIEIETPTLWTLPVSGVFSVDDTETFLDFLRSLEGVSLASTSTRIRVYQSVTPSPGSPPGRP